MVKVDLKAWEEIIKKPDWYFELVPEFKKLATLHNEDRASYENLKEEIYSFFENKLKTGEIALGRNGEDWDADRKPIDTVVIHHTSNPPGLSEARLSAIELVRLYAPFYFSPYPEDNLKIKGQPIWSNHMRDGKQVFWPYHWSIKEDGFAERLLFDNEIGWQAGTWEVNCRSVGICFDGDYEDGQPSEKMLQTAAKLINDNYPGAVVIGHNEVNLKTTCPSKLFLDGWKKDLISLLDSSSNIVN